MSVYANGKLHRGGLRERRGEDAQEKEEEEEKLVGGRGGHWSTAL